MPVSPRTSLSRAAVVVLATLAGLAGMPGQALAADPVRVSTSPANGSHVQTASSTSATYDMALSPLTEIDVTKSGVEVNGSHSVSGNTVTFRPGPANAPTAFTDGTYTVFVLARGLSAPTTDSSFSSYTFTVDNTDPPVPSSVTISPDPITSATDDAVTVSGVGEANGTASISVDDAAPGGAVTGTAPTNGSGAYSLTLNLSGLADGAITASVRITDKAGNQGPALTDTASKDATAPAVLQRTPAAGAAVPPTSTVSVTTDQVLDLAASSIVVRNGSDNSLAGTATAPGDGKTLVFTLASELGEAGNPYSVTAVLKDALGNSTETSWSFSVDSTAPDAPTVDLPAVVWSGNAASVPVTGTAEPLSTVTVTVTDGDGPPDRTTTTLADADGDYATTIDLSGPGFSDGTVTATATATDSVGNTSPASAPDTALRDVTAPAAPTLSFVDPVSAANAGAVPLEGTAEPSSTVTVTVDDVPAGSPLTFTTTADGTGAYSLEADLSTLNDGPLTATATAADAAGNPSDASVPATTTKDTGIPVKPVVTLPDVNEDTASATEVTGTAEAGTTVDVTVTDSGAGTASGSTTATPGGTFSVTVDLSGLADGPLLASATSTDGTNTSEAGTDTAVKDTLDPLAPTGVTLANATFANKTAVPVTGSAEPGSTVTISVDDAVAGDAVVVVTTAGAGGGFSTTANLESLPEGPITATVTAKDAAGNTGPATLAAATKDTVVPAAPAITAFPDPVTPANVGAVAVNGTAESGATIALSVADTDAGTPAVAPPTQSATGGNWSFTLDLGPLSDGILTATATATDAVGNVSTAATRTATKNTVTLAFVSSAPASDSRVQPLSVVDVTFNEPISSAGSTIAVKDKTLAVLAGATSLTGDGKTLRFTGTDPLSEAGSPYTVEYSATDPIGETATGTFQFVVDATPPDAPAVVLPDVNGDTVTAVLVTGTGEPGATITLSVSDGTSSVSPAVPVLVADDGTWSATLDLDPLADGPLTATASQADEAGNASSESTDTAAMDTADPAAPTVDLPAVVNQAGAGSVALGGDAEDGSTVSFTVGDANPGTPDVTGTATAAGGTWSVTLDLASLADGLLTASATSTDAAGNTGAAGTDTATKDTVAPAPPSVSAPTYANSATSAAWPVAGTAAPGSTVNLAVDDAVAGSPVTATTTADGSGDWSTTLDVRPLGDGPLSASATATDAAGNTSTAGADSALKDTAAPAAATVSLPQYVNAATDQATPLTGTAEVGSTVAVAVGAVSTSVTAAGDGTWSATLDLSGLADGPLTASAAATDAAGNTGAAGTGTATKDTIAPAVPVVGLSDPVSSGNVASATVSGTAEPGATVAYTISDTDLGTADLTGTATADGAGAWSATRDVSSLSDGTLTASATATDAAGNTGAAGTGTATKDVVAPGAPSVDLPAVVNDAGKSAVAITGSAPGSASVSLSVDDTVAAGPPVVIVLTPDGDGSWSTTADLSGLADGTLTATATATDAAGNTGAAGSDTTTKDTVAPATPTVTLADPIDAANDQAAVIGGTGEDGSTVAYTVTDTSAGSVSGTAPVTGGAWTATLDLSGLDDGTLTAVVAAGDAAGNTSATAGDTATKATAAPAVTAVAPASGARGRNDLTVVLTGTDFRPGGGASFGPGVTVDSFTVDSGTSATAVLDIASDAATGTRDVTVTNSDGTSGTLTGGFTVTTARVLAVTVSPAPVSGTAGTVTVSMKQSSDDGAATDTTYTGTPALTSTDTHFTAGTCPAAVAGVSTCTGVVFGDLGAKTLTATATADDSPTGSAAVTVQPTGLAFTAAPGAGNTGQSLGFTVAPTAGVAGATISGYTATRTLTVTGGGSTPGSGPLACGAGACTFSLTFSTGGSKTVAVADDGTPSRTASTSLLVTESTALSIVRSINQTDYGKPMVLSGVLVRGDGTTPLAGRTVRVFTRTGSATTYVLSRALTTDANGRWSTTYFMTRNTAYRAEYAGEAGLAPATSAAVFVQTRAGVSISQPAGSTATVARGTRLAVIGGTSPTKANTVVRLVRKLADGRLVQLQAVRSAANGRWRFDYAFAAPGRYTILVLVAADAENVSGRSREIVVTVT